MENNYQIGGGSTAGVDMPVVMPVGEEQCRKFMAVLQQYKAGKHHTEQRIVSSEQWWKMRNDSEEQKETEIGKDGGFVSQSGWIHNVVVSKHADAMESIPEPNILPREEGDKAEAEMLSGIIPCIMEQNAFESVYSDSMWKKMKFGTGSYKVVWDTKKLNGLGDIGIESVNLLNLFWEPGVTDIQKSRYFFHTEPVDKELLEDMYPSLKDKLKSDQFTTTKFVYDDTVSAENKFTVIDVYYHKMVGTKSVLHYCKFVGDQVLFASENEPDMAERGYYDHGQYPYVLDPLFPVEGSPCGYGFVDIGRNPQIAIDLMDTAFVKNAMVGATPRYFSRVDGSVNIDDFLDLSKPIVHVNGSVSDEFLRRVEHTPLDGNYVNVRDRKVQELRETSGNTETSTGSTSAGVTAASAIAALQEASGKGSRDSTQATYRAYTKIVGLCIELIRQFYDMPRQFRIAGEYGAQKFVTYTNAGLKMQHQGNDFGQDMGYRLPVFDIKVSAQRRNVYSKITQNELALQFFQLGFFNPQMADQALMCLGMMEFDGKDGIMQKIRQNGGMYLKLQQYMQLAMTLAQVANRPEILQGIMQDMAMQGGGMIPTGGMSPQVMTSDMIGNPERKEHPVVEKARNRSIEATQPQG